MLSSYSSLTANTQHPTCRCETTWRCLHWPDTSWWGWGEELAAGRLTFHAGETSGFLIHLSVPFSETWACFSALIFQMNLIFCSFFFLHTYQCRSSPPVELALVGVAWSSAGVVYTSRREPGTKKGRYRSVTHFVIYPTRIKNWCYWPSLVSESKMT